MIQSNDMRAIVFLMVISITSLSCLSPTQTNPQDSERWWTPKDRQYILDELDRTTQELEQEVTGLNHRQWHFRIDSTAWSLAEIIEHLEMQNLLHFARFLSPRDHLNGFTLEKSPMGKMHTLQNTLQIQVGLKPSGFSNLVVDMIRLKRVGPPFIWQDRN